MMDCFFVSRFLYHCVDNGSTMCLYLLTHPEQRLSDLVYTAEYNGGKIHFGQWGGCGGDGGHHGAAREVHDGSVKKDGGDC